MAVVIKDVQKHSPAEKYGIKAGDTLVAINGEEINDMLDLQFYQSNAKLEIKLISDGTEKSVTIK